jgi:hypothetical protein
MFSRESLLRVSAFFVVLVSQNSAWKQASFGLSEIVLKILVCLNAFFVDELYSLE